MLSCIQVEEVITMKKYTILFANKTYCYSNLQIALDYAKRQSLVNFRVSVFDGNKKLATYEKGDVKVWNL